MYYLYSREPGLEYGPFTANSRQDAIKVVHRALKRDIGPPSYVKTLINELEDNSDQLKELTQTEIDNIKRNYSSLK